MAGKGDMRGLRVFIADLRSCDSEEKFQRRIDKELGNIRQHYKSGKGGAAMDGYNRRKYTLKLLYIYMLGFDVDFGHVEAVNLLSSNRYSEKCSGYLFCSTVLNENHELVPLIINSIGTDLKSTNESYQCLGLCAIANIGGKEMAEALMPSVQQLMMDANANPWVKKKAIITSLRLFRKYPDTMPIAEWAPKMSSLLDGSTLSVKSAAFSVLIAMASKEPEVVTKYVIPRSVEVLRQCVKTPSKALNDYRYYNLVDPWLQVKILRLLQLCPPTQDPYRRETAELISYLLNNSAPTKVVNHNHAMFSVVFEAINLVVLMEEETALQSEAAIFLGSNLTSKEPNMRYLTLEAMTHLASVPHANEKIRGQQALILDALKDADMSIRLRALDLLYAICEKSNAKEIVEELLKYLALAPYEMKEELVLKIAILAEAFAPSVDWYVDVILRLIRNAGDFVSDDIWHRLVQMITNNESMQFAAAKMLFEALTEEGVHQMAIKGGAYVLGEFGHVLVEHNECKPEDMYLVLRRVYNLADLNSKALIVSSMGKMMTILGGEVRQKIADFLQTLTSDMNADIQQRAVECLALASCPETLTQTVYAEMPVWPDKESSLLTRLKEQEKQEGVQWTAEKAGAKAVSSDIKQGTSEVSPPKRVVEDLIALETPERPSKPVEVDIFGTAPVATQPAQSLALPTEQELTPTALAHFTKGCIKADQLMYEDENIQIGLRTQYQGNEGRLAFFFGNKSGQDIINVSTVFTQSDQLQINPQPVPTVISAGVQISQIVAVSCFGATRQMPLALVAFRAKGKDCRVVLKLPIPVTKFLAPKFYDSANAFFDAWKAIAGQAPTHIQTIFKAANPFTVSDMKALFSNGFKCAVLENMDPNKDNLVAAATLGNTPLLVRLECNVAMQMLRLTVRSLDGELVAAADEAFKLQLA